MESLSETVPDFSIIAGDIFTGFISHVVSSDIFYVVLNDTLQTLKKLEQDDFKKMFWYPSIDEIFILSLDEGFFRAKRVNSTNSNYIYVQLMDTGEIFSIPNNSEAMDIFYTIPDNLKFKALAIHCKCVKSALTEEVDENFLKNTMHKKLLTFEAVKVKESTVYVKIWPYESHDEENKMFSAEEIEELYEEPLNTRNPLVAVHGFSTSEDRLCQFYNSSTGACFKGSSCKLKHLPIAEDSYDCRDRVEVFVHKENFDAFATGKYYSIKILDFIAINNFTFRVVDPNYRKSLAQVQEFIANDQKTYKKLPIEPEVNDLVLVKIKENFYRSKIVRKSGEDFVVWMLDFGSLKLIKCEMIYEWTMRLNDWKFLTHEIEISNILRISCDVKKSIKCIMNFQHKSVMLQVLITQTTPFLQCKLFDMDMKTDIGKVLVAEGLATENKFDLYDMQVGLQPL